MTGLRFDSQAPAEIYDDVVTLLADAELLFSAGSTFVTYTAEYGMFLGMRRGHADRPEMHSLDAPIGKSGESGVTETTDGFL